jgi:hypothetical protein
MFLSNEESHGRPAEETAMSDWRKPIVLTNYGGTAVDSNREDPELFNITFGYVDPSDVMAPPREDSDVAPASDGVAKALIRAIRSKLLPHEKQLTFRDLETRTIFPNVPPPEPPVAGR